jgi:hypothetical protein
MASTVSELTAELSGLLDLAELAWNRRELDRLRTLADAIRAKGLEAEGMIDPASEMFSPSWLIANSAKHLVEGVSTEGVDWEKIGGPLSFVRSGIDQLTQVQADFS